MKKLSQKSDKDSLCYRVRAAMKLSQRDFAQVLGVHVRTISKWEGHERTPNSAAQMLLKMLAKKHNVSV